METAPGIFYVSLLENVCLCLGKCTFPVWKTYVFALWKLKKNKAFAAYCQGEIKNMLGFALFLLPEDEFLRICVTFVAYRVLTFNKHIYGSQEIA